MPGTPAYHAFVSYSHAADAALAPALRLALHKFAKPWYKTRALAIFLDQSSLSANPALWAAIERALSSAKHFILLASPESAASPWVRKEVDWWLRHRSVDSMLVLLTGGELIWASGGEDFDWTRTTSIARELAGRFPAEPLYVDLRAIKSEGSLSLRDPKFRAAVLDIAAPLHGRNKDDLDGEDIVQNRRTMRIARGVAVVMALLAAAAVWQAIAANQQRREAEVQRNEAITQRGVAERETARALTQEEIANEQRDIAEKQTVEAKRQERIATEQRDEAVRQRDLALARRLVSDSSRQIVNPLQWNLAMLLAIESMRKTPTADSYELLARLWRDGARTVASFPGEQVAAFSPDSRLIATAERHDLVVREARGGRERARVDRNSLALWDACFTPGSERVLGYNGDEAMLVDVAAGRVLRLPVEIERGGQVSVSANCRFLAAARDGKGYLFALESNTLVGGFPAPARATALAASDDGDGIAYAEGPAVTVVGVRSGARRGRWVADQNVTGAQFAQGERLALSVGTAGTVILDAATVRPIRTSPARGVLTSGGELSADLEREGRELVTWDVGRGVWTKRLALTRSATNLDWSDDGEFLVYGGGEGDGAARVLQSESWRQLARFAFPIDATSLTPAVSPSAVLVRISPSANLASAAVSNRAVVFEIHQDRAVVTLPAAVKPGAVALSRNAGRAAFRTIDGRVSVVDTATARELAAFECDSSRTPVRLSGNGRVVGAVCGASLVTYDVDAKRQLVRRPAAGAGSIAMSRDGALLFAGRELIRSATGTPLRPVPSGGVAAFDARGRRVAIANDAGIDLVDVQTAAAPRRLNPGIDLLESVGLSEDGQLLAAGGRNMRVKIFDTATGQLKQTLEHIEQDQWVFRIHRLVFSPSRALLATMADDPTDSNESGRPGTVRIFDVATGREIARFPFAEIAHDVRFAADDSALEIAVGRRRIRWERYPLAPSEVIAKACTYVQRNMEAIEWTRFMGDEPRRETCPAVSR